MSKLQSQTASQADLTALYQSHGDKIRRYLAKLAGVSAADDLLQAVFLKASAGLAEFRFQSSLATWIFRIATNAAMDSLRERSSAKSFFAEKVDGADPEPGPDFASMSAEDELIRRQMGDCIKEFIDALPHAYRLVIILADLEGFTPAEIAEVLGVNLDTAKIRLHRARVRLRKELSRGCRLYHDGKSGFS
jgi:RNA polymerase sigma-70 factor (ECF subfamily)